MEKSKDLMEKEILILNSGKVKDLFLFLRLFMFMFFFFVTAIMGGFFNLAVITFNGGRMPVFTSNNIDTGTHFSFQNFDDVNYPFLADILSLNFIIFSVGDFLIVVSFIGMVYVSAGYILKSGNKKTFK